MAKGQNKDEINCSDVCFHVWALFFAFIKKKYEQLIRFFKRGIESSTLKKKHS